MLQDVRDGVLAEGARLSMVSPSLQAVYSPVPRASWDAPAYAGRVAFVKTLRDLAVPTALQEVMIAESGVEWMVREVDASHSPQLARPREMLAILGPSG